MDNKTDNSAAASSSSKTEASQSRSGSSFVHTPSGSAKTKSNLIEVPSINLPKGGGAMKGIDEKFTVNPSNGTASYSIPLPLSAGRNGFTPQLDLGYNSGGGNGIFGIGWSVDYPAIQRKTDKRLPQYRDAQDSDVFVFSGAEELVPELIDDGNGGLKKNIFAEGNATITRYRPRIEGTFTRIEKVSSGVNVYWRVRTRDNVVSVFGKDDACKLFNPAQGKNDLIFKWCLQYTYDDKGNYTRYEYKKENLSEVSDSLCDKNRLSGISRFTNIYLKRVLYGNKVAFYEGDPDPAAFCFEVVFDFGEHDLQKPATGPAIVNGKEINWPPRKDAFSDYKAGFEIRTYRLCKRILMFHHFREELGFEDYLVKAVTFSYDERPHITYLDKVTQSGYIWRPDGSRLEEVTLPPMEFTYTKVPDKLSNTVADLTDHIHAPIGLDGSQYQWIDLFSESVSGILTDQGNGWYYKDNLGSGNFGPAHCVALRPSFSGLDTGAVSFQELEGNGKKYLVKTDSDIRGFWPLSADGQWEPFVPFEKFPNIDLKDPNLKFLDLNGDGMPDLLISHEQEFVWYESQGKVGYDDYHIASKENDDELGPRILFSEKDEKLLIATADMSGDGLADILVVTNANVFYYPNLGYGNFGARVTLEMPQCFDTDASFNPAFIHLADIDGSGTTDIIYTGLNMIQVRFNQSGNRLSVASEFFNPFPSIDDQSKITFVDLLANGTSCIVWSSSLPANGHAPIRYIDMMKGQKPHLMYFYKNNSGKEVTLEYRSSSQFYLDDMKAGRKWITRLPFPVQCLSKMIVVDKISQTRFASEYSYHHGYYDGIEREFRGFAMVEQKDTEEYDHFVKETNNAGAVNSIDKDLFQPVVTTRSWFHTGSFVGRDNVLHQLRDEYYPKRQVSSGEITDPEVIRAINENLLSEAELPLDVTTDELIEHCRAMKGLPLRQEVYSDEGPDAIRRHPYAITQNNYDVQMIQPKFDNEHAVFLSHEKEKLVFNLERNPLDPRIAHTINTSIDVYGNVLESASIVYGRKKTDPTLPTQRDQSKQSQQHVTYSKNSYTTVINRADALRLPVACESETWELNAPSPSKTFFSSGEIKYIFKNASVKLYEQEAAVNEKRKIEHTRTLFLRNDLTGPLPLGTVDTLALPYQNYLLAFSPTLVQNIYGGKVDDGLMKNESKYTTSEGDTNYWISSGRSYFHPDLSATPFVKDIQPPVPADVTFAKNNFYLPVAYEDNFRKLSKVFYDGMKLSVKRSIDVVDNETTVDKFNYRTMSPTLVRDPNDNRAAVRFDALGLAVQTFSMGKQGEFRGDLFDDTSLEKSVLDKPGSILEYEFRYFNDPTKPNRVKTTVFEKHHYKEKDPGASDGLIDMLSGLFNSWPEVETIINKQESYTYSDGSGHEVLKKVQAESGLAPERDVNGKLIFDPSGNVKLKDTSPLLRWVGNGRTIYNNKGKAVKQYEPFFDSTFEYNTEKELIEIGFTSIIFYDALGRAIKTERPDGTFSKVEFDAWTQKSYDENDTVKDSTWYASRIDGSKGEAERLVAQRSSIHHNTPGISYLDSLGRPYIAVAHNKTQRNNESVLEEFYFTRTELDIEGNAISISDARNNTVMTWKYDMLGNLCYQHSMDAGDRWTLLDVMGKAIRLWDDRSQEFAYEYDDLHRPLKMIVKSGADELHYETFEYGELITDAKKKNLKGKLFRHKDTAGIAINELFDFKGNLTISTRELTEDYKQAPNWKLNPVMTGEKFKTMSVFDALNRPLLLYSPDKSIYIPTYNEAGLAESVSVKIKGDSTATTFVVNIDYDAKGQRERILYGNNTVTRYDYDPKTWRLKRLLTTNNGSNVLQDLNYTYDPVGNIAQQFDNAQKTIFYGGQKVEAESNYIYDAIYRLIEGNGREHIGQAGAGPMDNFSDEWCKESLQPNSPMQLRGYTQKYFYDAVGNIQRMQHIAGNPGNWTRQYTYNTNNNRLLNTMVGNDTYPYSYNEHGSLISMPHLPTIDWNFRDEMIHLDLGGGSEAWYNYDSSGQRIRKVVFRPANKIEERIYLGAFEIYRERMGNTTSLERETFHVMDDKQRIAMIETRTKGNDGSDKQLVRYQYSNHLGSACLELDVDAKIISYEEYHPYGTSAYRATDASRQVPLRRYRYSGLERDEESGLNYHSARYYVPWLGRWMAVDPIGAKDALNIYGYVGNNPIGSVDLTGNYSWSEFGSDVWKGVKGAAKGVVEPALVVMDFGQMGAAVVTKEFFPKYYHDVDFLSQTGQALSANPDQGFVKNVFHAAVEPVASIGTLGAYNIGKNIYTIFDKNLSPDEARSLLVQGAAGQVAATGFAMGMSKASGTGWTGKTPATASSEPSSINSEAQGKSGSEVAQSETKPTSGEESTSTETIQTKSRPSQASQSKGKGGGNGVKGGRNRGGGSRSRSRALARSASLRKAFMRTMLKRILDDPNHLLRFLVDPKTKTWRGTSHLSEEPTVQAGHLTSRHSGAAEFFAIEDSLFNQLSNWKGETQGAIFSKGAVDIGNVPVELRTAIMYESIGAIPKGTVQSSAASGGWHPAR